MPSSPRPREQRFGVRATARPRTTARPRSSALESALVTLSALFRVRSIPLLLLPPTSLFTMTEVDYKAVTTHPISVRTSGKDVKYHKPHADTAEYEKLYKESITEPTQFWDRVRPPSPCLRSSRDPAPFVSRGAPAEQRSLLPAALWAASVRPLGCRAVVRRRWHSLERLSVLWARATSILGVPRTLTLVLCPSPRGPLPPPNGTALQPTPPNAQQNTSLTRIAALQMAKEHLYWHRPYSTVMAGSFEAGDVQWFPEGGLNVSYNCVDRWAYKHPNKARPSLACRTGRLVHHLTGYDPNADRDHLGGGRARRARRTHVRAAPPGGLQDCQHP